MINTQIIITEQNHEKRLDLILSQGNFQISRARFQKLISEGGVLVNGKVQNPSYKCNTGDKVIFTIPEDDYLEDKPENLPLNIVFEDEHLMVINKPAGLTVHPGNGQKAQTLLNGLLFHRPELANVARAGIVHRLDKDTSGLMVIAKTGATRLQLIKMIANHEVSREYLAIAVGKIKAHGTINQAIARHPTQRTKMAVVDEKTLATNSSAKSAITHFRVLESINFAGVIYNLIHCRLETGRTHQIRVHLSFQSCPILGDLLYLNKINHEKIAKIVARQMLHAFYLQFIHPQTQNKMCWQIDIPDDFYKVLLLIKEKKNVA